MKAKSIIILLILNIYFSVSAQVKTLAPSKPSIDSYHGVDLIDEYRNFENLEDSAVINWVKSQSEFASSTLKNISNRDNFLKRLREIDNKNDFLYYYNQITKNNKRFYIKQSTNDKLDKLYYRIGFEGEEIFLFDPKQFKPENNKVYIISHYEPNNEGSKVAIALTEGGKEIAEIIIFDIETKSILPQVISNTWPSDIGGIQWLNDDSGFIYVHIPNIDKNSDQFIKNTKSVVYKIGDDSSIYKDIFSKANNKNININEADFPIIDFIDNSNYIIGNIGGATQYSNYYYAKITDIYNEKINWKPFYTMENKVKSYVIDKEEVVFITEKDGKSIICKTSLISPDFNNPDILVSEFNDELISSLEITKDGIFFITKKNGVTAKLYLYKNKNYKELKLPISAGNIKIYNIDSEHSELWVYCSGWTQNGNRYRYDSNNNVFILEDFNVKNDFTEYDSVIVEEIEIKTHDGSDLPLTIIYKKGLQKNSKNRVIMEGYGSYGRVNSPYFSPYALLWVLDGGILVQTHERGGGEKGDTWHKGGYKETKPNTWKDFISSAEYLIAENYTSSKFIGISSGSAGGILIGRAITERPDLFKAANIDVGLLNSVRFETTPNGPNNVKEFGTVAKENEFKALLEMDAYHHIKKGVKYPATLITAGMNDPRVIAWIPTKFAAKLQANNKSKNPILLNVDFDGGHGGNDNNNKSYENFADKYAFFYWQLGHPDYKLNKKITKE